MGTCDDGAVYSRSARWLHWSTVALLGVQVPVGLFMVRYGVATDFAAPSGVLYDGHKLLGLLILLLAAGRLAHRLARGAPPSEPSLAAWQKTMSHVTHWAIYAMLLAVPLLGWLAISNSGDFLLWTVPAIRPCASRARRGERRPGATILPSTAWPPRR